MDEDQPAADVERDAGQGAVGLVDEETIEIGGGEQRAIGAERPAMIGAGEGAAPAAFLLDQLGTAMGADIVEGANLAIAAAPNFAGAEGSKPRLPRKVHSQAKIGANRMM